MTDTLAQIIDTALAEIAAAPQAGKIVSLAFYCDHENDELCLCADTSENSDRFAQSSSAFSQRYMMQALDEGDLGSAQLWNAAPGRSLSLGDYVFSNLARSPCPAPQTEALFLAMAQSLRDALPAIRKITDPSQPLLLVCSTAEEETGLFWTEAAGG